MNIVIWARVSSREQREGYSIDAQLRADREQAYKAGWIVVREFVVAESAKRGAERTAFNDMLKWVIANAKALKIGAILSHKLDRICRNMRDAVRLQELEDSRGVRLEFVENEFGPGPAGALSFNVMAAVAQYYSDNLRTEVLKGIDERARQGWAPGLAAYGYQNVRGDREEPIQTHPVNAATVVRLFELYATGRYTLDSLSRQLSSEGRLYRPSQPRFMRTGLAYILKNRFYIGEIKRGEHFFPGKHRPLIDRATFRACQDQLSGKNRKSARLRPEHPLAAGLFRCEHCGALVTGERIQRKQRDGSYRIHHYYRCANNFPAEDHPTVRWKADQLEQAIITDLESFKMPDAETGQWFRTALEAAFADMHELRRSRQNVLLKRSSELTNMLDRLLTTYLAGTIDEATFNAKQTALKDELGEAEESLAELGKIEPAGVQPALSIFDFSQNAAEIWRRSNMSVRRRIIETISLNRHLSDTTLVTTKRKPFDALVERPSLQSSRDDRI